MADFAIQQAFGLALQHYNSGRLQEAESLYRQIIARQPDHADAMHLLGIIYRRGGDNATAIGLFCRAIAVDPACENANYNLANALRDQGQLDEAITAYQRAIALKQNLQQSYHNLGLVLQKKGLLEEASAAFSRADEAARMPPRKPDSAIDWYNKGNLQGQQGRFAEAIAAYRRAIAIDPAFAEAYCNLGNALIEEDQLDAAIAAYQESIQLNANLPQAHNNWGSALKELGRPEEALLKCDRALQLDPSFASACFNRGSILQDLGRFEEAMAAYRKAIALKPMYPEAYYNLAQLKTFQRNDPDLAMLESLERRAESLPADKEPFIHFALAKGLEDSQDYDHAFEQFAQGNAAKRRLISYDEIATRDYFRCIAELFNAPLLNRCQGMGDTSPVPIFVVGMPRSGSTLVEQILSSHSRVHAGGELKTLSSVAGSVCGNPAVALEYPASYSTLDSAAWRSLGEAYLRSIPALPEGKLRITDKMPGNFAYLGLIHLILPNARIVHTIRDPADTCLSCFSKLFVSGMPYTYDLAELGRYYRYYRKLMDHWRAVLPQGTILDVSYEELVNDLEGQSRRIIAHCNLEWDASCLGFNKNPRAVSTASNVHVRQPLFRSSIGRSRNYQAHLNALLRELKHPSEIQIVGDGIENGHGAGSL
jgi:tetratricopeptide (TPR) repeat protein